MGVLDGSVEPRAARGRTRVLAVGAAVAAGAGLAGQSRLNGELGSRIGDGVAASLASTTAGLVLLLALVPTLPAGRRGLKSVGAALRTGGLRWWHCLGGIGGAVACVAAVAVAVADRLGVPGTAALVVLPLLAGFAVATQSALNGRVGAAARSAWPATLVSFLVAELTLAVVLLAGISVRGAPVDPLPPEPWLYAAGLIGIGVIATAACVVGQVGVLVFSLASVAGQLLGALALDALTGGPAPTTAVWIGTAVTFSAVALAAHPGRRPGRE